VSVISSGAGLGMTWQPPSASDELRATASFYDAAAARYDTEVDVPVLNATLRNAFCRRVSSMAGVGNAILDFGCGTGTDAAWYASRGHHVIAYDISRGMVAVLRDRCATGIAEKRVTALAGDLDVLLKELDRAGHVSAVAANFAVLNHVRDLRPLFLALAPHVARGGNLLATILNPFYRRDMREGWWWRGMPRSLFAGSIRVIGDVTTYRHFRRTVRRMAAPHFALAEWRSASNAADGRTDISDSIGAVLADNFLLLRLEKCS
jgi:SAM-dependent methyltransferase